MNEEKEINDWIESPPLTKKQLAVNFLLFVVLLPVIILFIPGLIYYDYKKKRATNPVVGLPTAWIEVAVSSMIFWTVLTSVILFVIL